MASVAISTENEIHEENNGTFQNRVLSSLKCFYLCSTVNFIVIDLILLSSFSTTSSFSDLIKTVILHVFLTLILINPNLTFLLQLTNDQAYIC